MPRELLRRLPRQLRGRHMTRRFTLQLVVNDVGPVGRAEVLFAMRDKQPPSWLEHRFQQLAMMAYDDGDERGYNHIYSLMVQMQQERVAKMANRARRKSR